MRNYHHHYTVDTSMAASFIMRLLALYTVVAGTAARQHSCGNYQNAQGTAVITINGGVSVENCDHFGDVTASKCGLVWSKITPPSYEEAAHCKLFVFENNFYALSYGVNFTGMSFQVTHTVLECVKPKFRDHCNAQQNTEKAIYIQSGVVAVGFAVVCGFVSLSVCTIMVCRLGVKDRLNNFLYQDGERRTLKLSWLKEVGYGSHENDDELRNSEFLNL